MSSNYYNTVKEKRLRRITAVNFLSSISLDGTRRSNIFGIQAAAARRPSKRAHDDIENIEQKAKDERDLDRVSLNSESDVKLSSTVPRVLNTLNPFQPHRERGR